MNLEEISKKNLTPTMILVVNLVKSNHYGII